MKVKRAKRLDRAQRAAEADAPAAAPLRSAESLASSVELFERAIDAGPASSSSIADCWGDWLSPSPSSWESEASGSPSSSSPSASSGWSGDRKSVV